MIKYYTDNHDVDEDLNGVFVSGPMPPRVTSYYTQPWSGIMARTAFVSYGTDVAYKDKNSTPVTESRVLYRLFKFVDMSNYEGTTCYCVYRTLKC